MKNVVITAILTAVLIIGVAWAIGEWACDKANEVFDAKDAEIARVERVAKRSNDVWFAEMTILTDEKIKLAETVDYWETLANKDLDRIRVLETEIVEWEACAARRNAEPNEPITTLPVVPESSFTDQVQTSLKGVVHLQCPQWQGSGFVVGPRHIVTARHCTTGVVDFLMTLNNKCQFRATRAYRNKDSDVSHIWADDLKCVNQEVDHRVAFGGKHDVVLFPLPVGSIEDCVLGQSVYVIGSPYGKINFNSLTTGVISGVDRDWDQLGYDYGWKVAFTVDSAGHPGNSGCPIFTTDGVVRGILVGGFSPVLISVMPCDLFLADLDSIRLMFVLDRYQREEAMDYSEDWYEYPIDPEYY